MAGVEVPPSVLEEEVVAAELAYLWAVQEYS